MAKWRVGWLGYLKGLAEFVAHNRVQQRIDAGGQVEQDARYVSHRDVDGH